MTRTHPDSFHIVSSNCLVQGEEMHSVFNGLLSDFGDGAARVMIAQTRPTPLEIGMDVKHPHLPPRPN